MYLFKSKMRRKASIQDQLIRFMMSRCIYVSAQFLASMRMQRRITPADLRTTSENVMKRGREPIDFLRQNLVSFADASLYRRWTDAGQEWIRTVAQNNSNSNTTQL